MKVNRFVAVIAVAFLALSAPALSFAVEPQEIGWSDLIPKSGDEDNTGGIVGEVLDSIGIRTHDQIGLVQDLPTGVTDKFNGQTIKLPGYAIPIAFAEGEGYRATKLILAPFIGACVHVPPPPPNQLVIVTLKEPQEMGGLFDPVYIIGELTTEQINTELAEIGYVMNDARTEVYDPSE